MATSKQPWYAGEHKDALFYVLIAVFFVEFIVGIVSFFYGIIHSAPETPGGPPVARFPWLGWAAASIMAPVGLLLLVHLAGTWVSRGMNREEPAGGGEEQVPEGMRRFYAAVRHAPTIVILLAILLLGAALFFVDGALGALTRLGAALMPYLPWLAVSAAALLAICFLGHAFFVYRHRKLEHEYAWRREVLAKTGVVLVDKNSLPLKNEPRQAIGSAEVKELGPGVQVLDAESKELPESPDKPS